MCGGVGGGVCRRWHHWGVEKEKTGSTWRATKTLGVKI